jgi:hypothetical protein
VGRRRPLSARLGPLDQGGVEDFNLTCIRTARPPTCRPRSAEAVPEGQAEIWRSQHMGTWPTSTFQPARSARSDGYFRLRSRR